VAIAQRYVAQQHTGRGGPSGLADVLEVVLDKGLVIDAYVRVSLVGIELLTVDARVVVASVDTYLRFAEAVNRLDLTQASNAQTLGDLVSGDGNGSRPRRDEERSGSAERALRGGDDERERDEQDQQDERDATGEEHDGGGLLSRIKHRGQAF